MTVVTDWVFSHPPDITGCCILGLGHNFRRGRWNELCRSTRCLYLCVCVCTAAFISQPKHLQASTPVVSVRCCRIHFLSVLVKCILEWFNRLLAAVSFCCTSENTAVVSRSSYRYWCLISDLKYSWYSSFYLVVVFFFSQKAVQTWSKKPGRTFTAI